MKSSMAAIVFVDKDCFKVEQVPIPRPGVGELLIRVEAAGLCHTDLDILSGRYPAGFPRIPGHEFAGTVVDVGEKNLEYRVGARVAVDPLVACGTCRNCVRGYSNLCFIGQAYGAELNGGFAEFATVLSQNAFDVGDMNPARAALAEPFACAVNAIDRAGVEAEGRVAIVGAGPMGMILAATLRGRGIGTVVVADRFAERLERAGYFGAKHTVFVEGTLADSFSGNTFDFVIDATGRPDVLQQSLGLLADGGTLVPFGVCPPGSEVCLDPYEIYRRQLRIIGSFSLAGGIPAAVEVLHGSEFALDALVTNIFTFEEAEVAFAGIGQPETIKIQFHPKQQFPNQ